MKTHALLFLIGSCVAQIRDINIGIGKEPGKGINIGIPKTDLLNNLEGGGKLISDVIGTLQKTLAVVTNPHQSVIPNKSIDVNPYDGFEDEFEIDAGNPDINAKIERPCEVYDTFCIRRFFAEHSKCRISEGPVPDPYFRAQVSLSYPRVNIGGILINTEYGGLNNARVEEFYINKATDNLIITLEFDSISLFSNNTYLKFYLKGREPVLTRDFGGAIYGKFSITVIIPQLNDLRLDKAEITTYANSAVFPFVAGPRLAVSTDPEVLARFAEFIPNVPTDEQETLVTEGNFYAATYIQYNMCDFGLKVL